MIPVQRRFLICVLGVLLLVVVTTGTVVGAPAYKVTIRGPGLADTIVVWLASDEHLLRTFNSDLSSEVPATAPPATASVYDITWFFGRCWQTAPPCTADPAEVTTHRTRYAFDTDSQQGALAHLDTPAWFTNPPKDSTSWYRTSTTFDLTVQKILIMHGVVAALPATGRLADTEGYLIMAGIVGIIIGALVLCWYARRHQHDAG
jgi:hypothetical protein